MKVVNCYLAKSDLGWHIIDTGFHTEEAKLTWKNVFKSLHISPQDIIEIVVTHYHPDHFGIAGWLQEYTNASVKISKDSRKVVQNLGIEEKEAQLFDLFSLKHGMNNDMKSKILEYLKESTSLVTPFPETTIVEEGDLFYWPDEYVAIHTLEHADGHTVFYSEKNSVLVAGDLLLPKITPNVGYFPENHSNPLKSFFDSLEKIQQYNLETVLSGHRHIYIDGNQRAKELISHHEERLVEILKMLSKPTTAQELSIQLFPFFSMDSDPIQLLFALQESLAHLIFLREKDYLISEEDFNGVVTFLLKE